jgi:hypothetical protein
MLILINCDSNILDGSLQNIRKEVVCSYERRIGGIEQEQNLGLSTLPRGKNAVTCMWVDTSKTYILSRIFLLLFFL